jgi:hypothetical protein
MNKVLKLNVKDRTVTDFEGTPSRVERAVAATCHTGKRWLLEMAVSVVSILLPVLNVMGKLSILITIIMVPVEISRRGHDIAAAVAIAVLALICMGLATWSDHFLKRHAYGQF